MLFEKFKSEDEFRRDFIRPLLTRLGFLSIAELDGPQEFGKDFVFSEVSPFGFMRHYAVVAKHERKINQPGRLCEVVLSQIKQAFSVSFRLPESTTENYVSCVLVMNSGSISNNAHTWLRSELRREKYGENTHIFCGERLSQLDMSAAFLKQQDILPRLLGLKATLEMNLIVWSSIEKSLPKFSETRGCFTSALEDYICAPFLTQSIPLNQVAVLLQECRIVDSINNRYIQGLSVSKEIKEADIENIKRIISLARARVSDIDNAIQACFQSFRPYSIRL